MAADVSFALNLNGSGTWDRDAEISSQSDNVSIANDTTFAENVITVPRLAWTNGTGSGQINRWFHDQRSVNATTDDDLDIAGGLTDVFGTTITFAKIKIILVSVVSPDGSKYVQVGPEGVANGFVGPWGSGDDYTKVYNWGLWVDNYTGWTVTGGSTDILRISNQTAGAISYQLFLGGTS